MESPAAMAIALILVAIVGIGIARPDTRPAGLMRDFNAFYCAGRVIAQHRDPYRAEPLGRCEREPKPDAFLAGSPGLVMPAPLPPFALLPFIVISRLPYTAAAFIWCCCILLSVAVTVAALRRATGAPLAPLIAAFALTDGYAALCLGQVAPVAVAAIVLAAMLLGERRDRAAGFIAAIAMIEPHVGLPACLAMFVFRSRTRFSFIVAAVGCALASFATVGLPTTLEYVRNVIPAHAFSEIVNEKQFSLTYALHRFGLGDAISLRAGEWSYVAMLIFGIVLARVIAKRTGDNGAIATIPAAVALVGGPFVHIVQMSAALPAAFFLYRHASGGSRRALGCAIVLLAVPWIQFANLGTIFVLLAPFATAFLVATLVDRRAMTVAAAALLALLFIEELTYHTLAGLPSATSALLAHYDPRALAESSWTLYVRTVGTANVRVFDLAKIPTIAGLATLVTIATTAVLRPMRSDRARAFRARGWNGADASRRIATR